MILLFAISIFITLHIAIFFNMIKINTGTFQKVVSGYAAFYPARLPFDALTLNDDIISKLTIAERAIGELRGVELILPNAELLLQKYALKEALLSSQIEGTGTTIVEIIQGNKDNMMDVREVNNCMQALNYGIKKMRDEDFPLRLRLIKEIQGILMADVRGGQPENTPGEFRKSQNWIGGVNPATAAFVPPPPEVMIDAISDLENYLHEENGLPDLIKCALIHYQFEAIHPFCDGNGRTGRMIIILYMLMKGILNSPILYLSFYFKQNREMYYYHLSAVSKKGEVYSWIQFFLDGIIATSKQVVTTTKGILALQKYDKIKLSEITRYNNEVIDFLMQRPVIEIKELEEKLGVSYNTAKSIVEKMVEVGILEQISEGHRNKRYVYKAYMAILEEGCENF